MWSIEALQGLDALDRVAAEWQDLLEAWPGHTFFQTQAWCRTFARHTTADSEVIVLRLSAGGVPRGLVPLAVRRLSRAGLSVRRLEWLGTGPSDRTSWLLPPDVPEAAVTAILDHILNRLGGWLVWDLRGLMTEAPGVAALRAQLSDRGVPLLTWPDDPLPVLHINDSWDNYAARRFKPSDHGRVRQLWRKLEARGGIRTRMLDHADDGTGVTARLCQVPHRGKGYGREFQIPFEIPRLRAFLADMTGVAAQSGWLRLGVIEREDTLIAYRYDFEYRSEAYGYFSGYDPAYADCGPGRLLLTDYIESCFKRGVTHFHFLRGAEAYKAAWTDDAEHNVTALAFRPTPVGRSVRAAYRWRERRLSQPEG